MMDKLSYPILTNVLEVISAANDSLDCVQVRRKAMDAMIQTIPANGVIFFLPDGNGQFTYILIKDLDKTYCEYYKTYFHQFDPLQLTQKRHRSKALDRIENAISYDSFRPTEYYNDFLKPQKIHHKLIVNLIAEEELYGRIVLTRPRKSGRFSVNERKAARTISPYLAHALAHNELKRKIRLKENILNYIEKQSSVGVILLDESLKIVYTNPKAEEAFGKLRFPGPAVNLKDPVSIQLLGDCREIQASLKTCPTGGMMIPRHRVLKGPDHTSFSVISRVLDRGFDWNGSPLLMVSIEEQSTSNASVDPQCLIEKFQLSRRETDVVSLLFQGMTNSQIAQKLFVSEITVKKHLQNIYGKVGVSNRTTLMNRILTG